MWRRSGEKLGEERRGGGTRESALSARSEQNALRQDPSCVHTAPRKGNVSSYHRVGLRIVTQPLKRMCQEVC